MTISPGGKMCIIVGICLGLGGLIIAENPLIKLMSVFIGIVVAIQGLRMKSGEISLPKHHYYEPNSYYNPGLGIKKDSNSKGAI